MAAPTRQKPGRQPPAHVMLTDPAASTTTSSPGGLHHQPRRGVRPGRGRRQTKDRRSRHRRPSTAFHSSCLRGSGRTWCIRSGIRSRKRRSRSGSRSAPAQSARLQSWSWRYVEERATPVPTRDRLKPVKRPAPWLPGRPMAGFFPRGCGLYRAVKTRCRGTAASDPSRSWMLHAPRLTTDSPGAASASASSPVSLLRGGTGRARPNFSIR